MSNINTIPLHELYNMWTSGINNANQLKFKIPAIQRGLVWGPKQIAALWDSIIKGYPIGIFTVYETDDNNYALIDGQQRLNAICSGFEYCPNTAESTLWVSCDKEGQSPKFTLCTITHPWGFTQNV